jgi:hypothetical protein
MRGSSTRGCAAIAGSAWSCGTWALLIAVSCLTTSMHTVIDLAAADAGLWRLEKVVTSSLEKQPSAQ